MNAFNNLLAPALPADLLGRIGEAVASAAATLQTGPADDPGALSRGLAQLEDLGLQLQEAARVLAAPRGARPEAVDLGLAALQACTEWSQAFQRAGMRWTGPKNSCQVHTNAAVLKQIIDLAFGHALGLGQHIAVDVTTRGNPVQTLLTIVVSRAGGELFAARPGEAAEWHWALLTQLARHAGLLAERDVQATGVMLTLGFEPLAALEPMMPLAADPLPVTQMPPGTRVLLLEPHESTRVMAQRLMLSAGVKVTAVGTVDQAYGTLAHGLPDGLVCGLDTRDPLCADFVGDLRARQPGLRILEVTPQAHVFETSLPEAGTPARLARDDIERYLVPALAQEMSTPR